MTEDSKRTKAEQVVSWVGRLEPEEDHALGRCEECEAQVWIDTALRPSGMATRCEEHEPLCHFQGGGCCG